jgi:hypothetical protein
MPLVALLSLISSNVADPWGGRFVGLENLC